VIFIEQAIRHESFGGVQEFSAKSEQFVASQNKTKILFIWTATADSIFKKIQCLWVRISGAAH
jgi:hypothetical protein